MQQHALPLIRNDMSYQQSIGLCSAMEGREDGRSAANRDLLEHKIWARADSSGHKNPIALRSLHIPWCSCMSTEVTACYMYWSKIAHAPLHWETLVGVLAKGPTSTRTALSGRGQPAV